MKFHIHVGTHKTGTTSLQNFLSKNTAFLRRAGAKYVAHRAPFLPRAGGRFDPVAISQQINQARLEGAKNLILSSEGLTNTSRDDLTKMVEACVGCEVIFVVCFRHWATFLPSLWRQNCIRYDTQSFQTFMANTIRNQDNAVFARYDLLAERLAQAGQGRLKIVSYDNCPNGNILPTMLDALDLPDTPLAHVKHRSLNANRARAIGDMDRCRILNGVKSYMVGEAPNVVFHSNLECRRITVRRGYANTFDSIISVAGAAGQRVTALLDAAMGETTFLGKDERFTKWQDLIEKDYCGYFTNSSDGRLFNKSADYSVRSSMLEVENLGEKLRENLCNAIDRHEHSSIIAKKYFRFAASVKNRLR